MDYFRKEIPHKNRYPPVAWLPCAEPEHQAFLFSAPEQPVVFYYNTQNKKLVGVFIKAPPKTRR